MLKKRREKTVPQREVNELLDLCNAWLCVLLRRLGEGEHRFSKEEIRDGLGRLRLCVGQENGEYIFSLFPADNEKKEDGHGGDEA